MKKAPRSVCHDNQLVAIFWINWYTFSLDFTINTQRAYGIKLISLIASNVKVELRVNGVCYSIKTVNTDIAIPVFSSEEIRLPAATVSESYGIQGNLEVNISNGAPAGASEILWAGGIYGYGRFFVGNIDLPARVSNWSLF